MMTDQDLEDLISDTLAESFYTHWNERDGAKALVPILRQLFVPRVEGVVPVADQFDEDYFADAIAATMGPDWSPRDAAKLILQDFADNSVGIYPESVVASLQAQLVSVGALIDQFRFDSDEDVFRLIDAIKQALGADQ